MTTKFHNSFKFLDWQLHNSTCQLHLSYAMQDIGKVTETLILPKFINKFSTKRSKAINAACQLLHLVCGVSYYKAGLANNIQLQQPTSKTVADFVSKTWYHGLAELAYVNHVSLAGKCQIPATGKSPIATNLTLSNKALVAIGGGKDSLVTIEALRQQGKDLCLFFVGNAPLIKQVIAATGLPSLQVLRKIDTKLLDYNQKGAFNGHIPITAINSCVAVLVALLFDFDNIVFSNESSADSANTINKEGQEVNHQYSKSHEFEKDLCHVIHKEISPSLHYYSYLRQLSELQVLQKFAKLEQYFRVFSSCNRNFHLDGSHNKQNRWCCDCPKCRFVFLGMAAFATRQNVLKIFQHDMLDDATQFDGFAQLLGIDGIKPFECVGTIQESQQALDLIAAKPEWRSSKLLLKLTQELHK